MRIAVPNKGRLHEPTRTLLERAGLHIENGAERKLYANTIDPDVTILYVRTTDIPQYLSDGAADLGITGLDQIREAEVPNVVPMLDLDFGHCKLVLAAPETSDITTVDDLSGKTVATEFPNIARAYFAEQGITPEIVEVSGATELTPHVDMADAIIDITSTGTTLTVNRLTVIDDVLDSSVQLFARDDIANDKKTRQITTALQSVLAAEGKRYLMMNAPAEKLDAIKDVLPGLGGPTIMDIAGDNKVAIHVVVDERDVFEAINDVKDLGATGILVTEIERMIE
jgi:ATP phosphoribosyltransferase